MVGFAPQPPTPGLWVSKALPRKRQGHLLVARRFIAQQSLFGVSAPYHPLGAPVPIQVTSSSLCERRQWGDLMDWTTDEVGHWLEGHGLVEYKQTFERNGVTGAVLLGLTKQDIKDELEVPILLDRKRLWNALEQLRQSQPADGRRDASPYPPPQPRESVSGGWQPRLTATALSHLDDGAPDDGRPSPSTHSPVVLDPRGCRGAPHGPSPEASPAFLTNGMGRGSPAPSPIAGITDPAPPPPRVPTPPVERARRHSQQSAEPWRDKGHEEVTRPSSRSSSSHSAEKGDNPKQYLASERLNYKQLHSNPDAIPQKYHPLIQDPAPASPMASSMSGPRMRPPPHNGTRIASQVRASLPVPPEGHTQPPT